MKLSKQTKSSINTILGMVEDNDLRVIYITK